MAALDGGDWFETRRRGLVSSSGPACCSGRRDGLSETRWYEAGGKNTGARYFSPREHRIQSRACLWRAATY